MNRDKTSAPWNIIMTLCRTNISKTEEQCNGDDEDINISNDGGKATNDNNYHEWQPQNTNLISGCVSTLKVTRALQSHLI
jgi:hypothetical protein